MYNTSAIQHGGIDLRSDTVTQPCSAMKQAMVNAPLGDDVLGDDPTVQRLEATIAERLGKEAAIFVPSGTMANQLAIWLHCKRGDSVILQKDAHIFHYEAGAPAVLSGVMMRTIGGNKGIMDTTELAQSFPKVDPHFAPATLVCVEDTANKGGGTVYPLDTLDAIAQIAKTNKAHCHIDGARFFNAEIASGIPASRRAKHYDTVSICFSKGLGAPVGSALCVPKDWVVDGKRARKIFGGGLRQSGMLAAAALYALEHNIARLAEDHAHAQLLASGLQNLGLTVHTPATNMVYFAHPKAPELVARLQQYNIGMLTTGPTTIRAVLHKHITTKDVQRCIESIGIVVESL